MQIVVTGSLAYDYIMNFPGQFKEHILPDKAHMLSVSFLVDSMKKLRGGTAGNIAYTAALLGQKPLVVSAAGSDFLEYREFMHKHGIDPTGIREVADDFTASCFINTDQSHNQIVAFYPGAVGHAKHVTLTGRGLKKGDWVIISPTDPEAMAIHTSECKKMGVSYIFDPGKQTPRLDKAQISTGLDGAEALIGNDYEFSLMAKALGTTEEKLFEATPLTIMTKGEQGSVIFERNTRKRYEIPIAQPTNVVDPTGAGDAYLGALAVGLGLRLPFEVTGRMAALASTYCIERKGGQEHHFTKEAFKSRYQETYGTALAI